MLGADYKTKKELKGSIGMPLAYIETSMFGLEYADNSTFAVVGPCPYTARKWFASVTIENGLIAKVLFSNKKDENFGREGYLPVHPIAIWENIKMSPGG